VLRSTQGFHTHNIIIAVHHGSGPDDFLGEEILLPATANTTIDDSSFMSSIVLHLLVLGGVASVFALR